MLETRPKKDYIFSYLFASVVAQEPNSSKIPMGRKYHPLKSCL